jgi:hypothetical protein
MQDPESQKDFKIIKSLDPISKEPDLDFIPDILKEPPS